MALLLRRTHITNLPAVYRGEESYIRCWEPEHESAWRTHLERHLTQWIENFDRLTVALIGEAEDRSLSFESARNSLNSRD